MVTLEHADRRDLVRLLQNLPLMEDMRTRRRLLEDAGLQMVIPTLDLSGSPFVAAGTIVSDLARYGQVSYGNEALGLLLNTVKEFVGMEQQASLDALLIKYAMMDPTAPTPPVAAWQAPETGETVLEKIFGENTLHPIAFLARGLEAARAVAHLRVRTAHEHWTGTGFLIAPTLVMTNHHVVPSLDLLPKVEVRFNYQEDFDGQAQPITTVPVKPGGRFSTDKTLDYTLFELAEAAGAAWGVLTVSGAGVAKDEHINIIQHPYGQPKQITLQNNLVEYVDSKVIQYVATTNSGSSGAPVLNDAWQVVGIHHAGGRIQEPTTRRFYNRNEGIRIEPILAHLPDALRAEIDGRGG